MRIFILLLMTAMALGAQDLGTVEINEANGSKKEAFGDLFQTPDYFESLSYMENAPAQQRLTTQEAMFIPGVQGDPLKALKTLPGVTSGSDLTGELFLYGSRPEESQFTLNHLPIGYVFHFFGIHSVIGPEFIEQIDAYLGGFDTTYGNAMGGVIDITPRYPKGEVSGFGHVGLYDASFGATIPISDTLTLSVGGRRSYFEATFPLLGLDEDDGEQEIAFNEIPSYYDITSILSYQPNANNIFSLEVVAADDQINLYRRGDEVNTTGDITSKRGFTTLGGRWQYFYKNYSTNTVLSYMNNRSRFQLFADYYVNSDLDQVNLYHESMLEYETHKVSFGTEITYNMLPIDLFISRPPQPDDVGDYNLTGATKYRVDETYRLLIGSLFLQDIWQFNDAWSWRYGARFSHSSYGNLDATVDPRTSLSYAFNADTMHLGLSFGRYTQTPSGFKLIDDLGNPDLGYERSWHLIGHYDYRFSDDSIFSFEPYYKRFEALAIESQQTEAFSNSGRGFAYGFDLNVKMRLDEYYINAVYSYLQSKRQLYSDDSKRYRFYGEIPHTAQFIGGWKFSPNWLFSTLVKYQSGVPYTPVLQTGQPPVYGEPFSDRVSDYFTLNLKIAQQIPLLNGHQFEWSFEVMNATNHNNVSGYSFDAEGNKESEQTQFPLTPWFDLTYRF